MSSTRKTKPRRVDGDFLKIPLADDLHSYARVLPHAVYAFYDIATEKELALKEIARCPVLFVVAVMDYAIKSGRWVSIGNLPLEKHLQANYTFFIQDPLDPESFQIYFQSGEVKPATRRECARLERASVWDPEHVESRILDHRNKIPNKWVQAQAIK